MDYVNYVRVLAKIAAGLIWIAIGALLGLLGAGVWIGYQISQVM